MASSSEHECQRQAYSILACYVCRKRKIKCGREMPQCAICKETSQECTYPLKSLRPGPKIGSVHAGSQKRQLEDQTYDRSLSERRNTRLGPRKTPQTMVTSESSPSWPRSPTLQNASKSSNVLSLSFIIHPTFERCSPSRMDAEQNFNDTDHRYMDALMTSCDCLGLTLLQLNTLLPRYFEAFTWFQLFRLPEIQTKLRQIPTTSQRTALLAAMLAYGVKGLDHSEVNDLVGDQVLYPSMPAPSIHFRGLAMKYMEQAMTELEDEPLSLPLLQTLILNTHCLLVQGVRGRAWRYLGLCIRTAYELNLHLIDAGKHGYDQSTNVQQWCVDEEWRRAWWAIWEMDVFASVVRRCPAGIDWTQNVTFLPAEDERWYRGEPQPSCFLELNVNNRWKSLAATKNESPKAWFILINSMMKDAQNISSPTSIDRPLVSDPTSAQVAENSMSSEHQQQQSRKHTAAINRLSTVLNAQHCAVIALPKDLQYRGQYLNFGGNDVGCSGFISQRLIHCGIYSIHLMVELTKLMVLKYHIFPPGSRWSLIRDQDTADDPGNGTGSPTGSSPAQAESHRLVQYFEAADAVVDLIRGCSGDHYKHVNPFLACTTWLAGAVQLLRRSRLPEDHADRDLVTSNFEVVCLIYRKTVEYWTMSKVPLSNWETLESALEGLKGKSADGDRFHYEPPCVFTAGNVSRHSSTKRAYRPEAVSNPNGEFNSVSEIFKYLKGDGGMRDSAAPQPIPIHHGGMLSTQAASQQFPLFSTSNNVYSATPPLTEHSSTRQPISGITSSEQSIATGQAPNSISSEGNPIVFSPAFLETMPFAVDRHGIMDFSVTLDEMFSGSYLP